MNEALQYPIGRFQAPSEFSDDVITEAISTIAKFPAVLQETLAFLPEGALDKPYRPDGWTGRQVVNHLADSHMHCLARFKWTLTENSPTIKPYLQDAWVELPDSLHFPIGASLQMLQGIHARLAHLMASLTPAQRMLTYYHPESQKDFSLAYATTLYAWHSKHHLGHLLLLA